MMNTPCHQWTSKQSIKETGVEVLKNLFKVINVAFRGANSFSSADLTDEVCFLRDIVARHVFSVSDGMVIFDRLPVQLGQENVGNGVEHRFRGRLKQIRETDE